MAPVLAHVASQPRNSRLFTDSCWDLSHGVTTEWHCPGPNSPGRGLRHPLSFGILGVSVKVVIINAYLGCLQLEIPWLNFLLKPLACAVLHQLDLVPNLPTRLLQRDQRWPSSPWAVHLAQNYFLLRLVLRMEFLEFSLDDCLKLFGFQGPVGFQELRDEVVLLEAYLLCVKHSYFRSNRKSVLLLV